MQGCQDSPEPQRYFTEISGNLEGSQAAAAAGAWNGRNNYWDGRSYWILDRAKLGSGRGELAVACVWAAPLTVTKWRSTETDLSRVRAAKEPPRVP
jgi:hypothetical protein